MSSRDIHSRDGGTKVRDLLGSFFGILLLDDACSRPLYLISPWLSDFRLLNNRFGQFKDLFSKQIDLADNPYILFSEMLIEVSFRVPVRIITWSDVNSEAFTTKFEGIDRVEVMFEKSQKDHQKGLLTDLFYFEGSMNFTYSGVYKNREKITCNAIYDTDGKIKVSEAYLEFERIWNNLKSSNQ